jgi:hypothetical protein
MAIDSSSKHLENKITSLALELNELRTRKKNFIAVLNNLNTAYKQGLVDYESYSLLWDLHLANKSAEQRVSEFEAREVELVSKINEFKEQKAETKEKVQISTTLSYAIVLLVMLASIAAFTMLPTGIEMITGAGTVNQSTGFISEANITAYFSVAMSDNLTNGIEFSSVLSSSYTDVNATDNYNAANNGSTMYLAISPDSNVQVDMCINGSDMRNQYSNVISVGNMSYTYAYNVTNATTPASASSSTLLTTSQAKTLTSMVRGTSGYYRFWIDVPFEQPPGVYNNTVEFRIVQAGRACT